MLQNTSAHSHVSFQFGETDNLEEFNLSRKANLEVVGHTRTMSKLGYTFFKNVKHSVKTVGFYFHCIISVR